MTATDTTTVPDVDLTADVPCTTGEGCANHATWIAVTRCCRHHETCCDPCRKALVRKLANLPLLAVKACRYCQQPVTASGFLTWRPL